MKGRVTILLQVAFLLLAFANTLIAQRIKVIVDQDARGPATTDMQSILIFLQSDHFDVLGITTVSADQWEKEEPQLTFPLLEIPAPPALPLPVAPPFPLLKSK